MVGAQMEPGMAQIERLHSDVSCMCAELALQMDNISVAFKLLSNNSINKPYHLNTLLLLCNLYLKNMDYTNVVKLLCDPTQKNLPITIFNDEKMWKRLSLAHYYLQNFDESLLAVNKALDLSQGQQDPCLYILNCRIFLQAPVSKYHLKDMVPTFEKTLELTQSLQVPPLHIEALLSRAQLFVKHGDLDRAKMDLSDSMSILNAKNVSRHFEQNDFLMKTSFTYLFSASLEDCAEKSLEHLDYALDNFHHTQESAQPLTQMRAIFRCILGVDLNETLNELIFSLEHLSAEFKAMVCYLIGRLYLEIDPVANIGDAYKYLQLSVDFDPENPMMWVSLGFVLLRMNQLNDSLVVFSHAIQLCDADLQAKNTESFKALSWYGIAENYSLVNDAAKVAKALENSIEYSLSDAVLSPIQELGKLLKNFSPIKRFGQFRDVPFEYLRNLNFVEDAVIFKVRDRILKEQIVPTLDELKKSKLPPSSPNSQYTPQCARKKTAKKSKKNYKKKRADIFRKMPLSISNSSVSKQKRKDSNCQKSSPSMEKVNLDAHHKYNIYPPPTRTYQDLKENESLPHERKLNNPLCLSRTPDNTNYYYEHQSTASKTVQPISFSVSNSPSEIYSSQLASNRNFDAIGGNPRVLENGLLNQAHPNYGCTFLVHPIHTGPSYMTQEYPFPYVTNISPPIVSQNSRYASIPSAERSFPTGCEHNMQT